MKMPTCIVAVTFILRCAISFAQRSSVNYEVLADGLGASGGRVQSATYSADTAAGGVVDISSGSASLAKHGYAGQLYDVTGLALTASPDTVQERQTRQASAVAELDDATRLALPDAAPSWAPLTSYTETNIGPARTVRDLNATNASAFYSVRTTFVP